MNELNCEYVRDVYPDALNGQADAALSAAVRAHVAQCADCREEAEAVAAIFAGSLLAPAHLHERVMNQYSAGESPRVGRMRYAALAATVAAALIGGSIWWNQTGNTDTQAVVVNEPAAPDLGAVTVEAALVSGKQSLQDLSIEELEQLLGEIES